MNERLSIDSIKQESLTDDSDEGLPEEHSAHLSGVWKSRVARRNIANRIRNSVVMPESKKLMSGESTIDQNLPDFGLSSITVAPNLTKSIDFDTSVKSVFQARKPVLV